MLLLSWLSASVFLCMWATLSWSESNDYIYIKLKQIGCDEGDWIMSSFIATTQHLQQVSVLWDLLSQLYCASELWSTYRHFL